jgi:hypothetical protein
MTGYKLYELSGLSKLGDNQGAIGPMSLIGFIANLT